MGRRETGKMKGQGLKFRYDTKMLEQDTAEIMVYSEIVSPGFKWEENEMSAVDFDKELKKVKGAKKLIIRINSPGGTATEAVAMRAMLLSAGFPETEVHIEGLCASAATLLCCLPGAKVIMAEGSFFMIHNPWSIAIGSAEEIETTAGRLRKMESEFRDIYSKASGQDDETIKAWMDAETWFTAKEAADAGFAHEVLEAEPIAASIAPDMLDTMQKIYRNTPKAVAETKEFRPDNPEVAAGKSAEDIKEEERTDMNINEITMDELKAENPELYESIMSAGSESERKRIQEIDELTIPGYEDLAMKAKQDGTSAFEFHKQLIRAQKERADKFMTDRQKELEASAGVPGGASEDTGDSAMEAAIKKNAQDIADYAKAYSGVSDGTMY